MVAPNSSNVENTSVMTKEKLSNNETVLKGKNRFSAVMGEKLFTLEADMEELFKYRYITQRTDSDAKLAIAKEVLQCIAAKTVVLKTYSVKEKKSQQWKVK